MRPEDIVHEYRAAGLTMSADGRTAVCAMQRPSLRGDSYPAELWLIAAEGEPRRLTVGPRDVQPKISPDGKSVAFLRLTEGAMQLMTLPLDGGEATQLTDQPLGVTDFAWSPCALEIAYLSRQAAPGRYGTVEGRSAGSEPARMIDSVQYQREGMGYDVDRQAQVFVVSATAAPAPAHIPTKDLTGYDFELDAEAERERLPESRQLTSDDAHYSRVCFGEQPHDLVVLRETPLSLASEVLRLDPRGVAPAKMLLPAEAGLLPFSMLWHGGSWYTNAMPLGAGGVDMAGKDVSVFRIDEASGSAERITQPGDGDFGEGYSVLCAERDAEGVAVALLSMLREQGVSQLARVDPGSGEVHRLTEGTHEITHVASAAGTTLVVVATADGVDEIARLEGNRLRVLTDFSRGIREAGVRPAQELRYHASDGTEVQGWVVLPEGAGPHPVLLNIHGGPHAQYTASFFDEAQVYASAGYAVVMCNPRGSAGYGEAFARSILRQMGTLDMQDILGYLDHALATVPSLDSDRVGLMGGSYGGYMTAWLLAHETRFTAGIVERGFLDPTSFSGISDIGWFFRELYLGDTEEQLLAQSPFARVDQVTTPTLIIHSEQDLRCPIEAAQRYFYRLRTNGVETNMLVFPGEGHELTRSGLPRHRVQRFHAILDWWQRHLPLAAPELHAPATSPKRAGV